MNRFLGRFTNAVRKPWQMYPLGVLFGLGFDTATEVALLFLPPAPPGRAAVVRDPLRCCSCRGRRWAGLPWYAILCLPVLFAAGMSLLDTIDGSFMNFAYGWAFSKPVRKVFYNLTVTGLSVAVALVIGTIELLSIAVERLDLTGGFWSWVAGIDLNAVGYVVVGLFVATWAVALAVWRFGHLEERWALPAASRERRGCAAHAHEGRECAWARPLAVVLARTGWDHYRSPVAIPRSSVPAPSRKPPAPHYHALLSLDDAVRAAQAATERGRAQSTNSQ